MSLFLVFDFVHSLDLFVVVYHKFIQFLHCLLNKTKAKDIYPPVTYPLLREEWALWLPRWRWRWFVFLLHFHSQSTIDPKVRVKVNPGSGISAVQSAHCLWLKLKYQTRKSIINALGCFNHPHDWHHARRGWHIKHAQSGRLEGGPIRGLPGLACSSS